MPRAAGQQPLLSHQEAPALTKMSGPLGEILDDAMINARKRGGFFPFAVLVFQVLLTQLVPLIWPPALKMTGCQVVETDFSGQQYSYDAPISVCVSHNNNSVTVSQVSPSPALYDMMPEYIGLFLAIWSRVRALELSSGRSMRCLSHGVYVGRDWSDLSFLYAGIAIFLLYVAVVKYRVTTYFAVPDTPLGCFPNTIGGESCYSAEISKNGEHHDTCNVG